NNELLFHAGTRTLAIRTRQCPVVYAGKTIGLGSPFVRKQETQPGPVVMSPATVSGASGRRALIQLGCARFPYNGSRGPHLQGVATPVFCVNLSVNLCSSRCLGSCLQGLLTCRAIVVSWQHEGQT